MWLIKFEVHGRIWGYSSAGVPCSPLQGPDDLPRVPILLTLMTDVSPVSVNEV